MSGINKINQSGATMLEAIGVLTIIIMLGVSIIKLINSIYAIFTQNMVSGEVRDLQKAISDIYRFEGNYNVLFDNGDTSKYLCDNKIAPFQMCVNNKLRSRSGGEVRIDKDPNAENNDRYAIIFEDLSQKICVNAAQINWSKDQRSSIYSLTINNKTVDLPKNAPSGCDNNGNYCFPISASVAMKLCNKEKDNDMVFVFY